MITRTGNLLKKYPSLVKAGLFAFVFSSAYYIYDKKPSSPQPIYLDGQTQLTSTNPDEFLSYTFEKETNVDTVKEYSTSYFLGYNVPDHVLNKSCAPIATFGIMEYWAKNGYPNLSSKDKRSMFYDVCHELKYIEEAGTTVDDVSPGLANYAASKGYKFKCNYYDSDENSKQELWDIVSNEIKKKRPVIGAIPLYASGNVNHAVVVTGVSEYYKMTHELTFERIRYLKLNDSYETSEESYMSFDNVDKICIITFAPQ